jgi:hypothetical protein
MVEGPVTPIDSSLTRECSGSNSSPSACEGHNDWSGPQPHCVWCMGLAGASCALPAAVPACRGVPWWAVRWRCVERRDEVRIQCGCDAAW